jgi:ATP-binding cassette, subfamily B (MDR/TAP), member 1
VINLLLRFYDPVAGRITLDGYNIKDLNIKYLRSQIGYVGQEPVLFAGSIADNIAYGLNPDVVSNAALTSGKQEQQQHQQQQQASSTITNKELMDKVIAAAKLANAHTFIKDFGDGYATDVGSNGTAMSGGQKQRIAIARALIKKPAVLLLDEATSALDASSERIVQQSIDNLARSKEQTTIIIAHRLSTIRNADKICVIKDGKIAEMGKHDELLALNGTYADLVRIQLSGHDEEMLPSSSSMMLNELAEEEEEEASSAVAAATAAAAKEEAKKDEQLMLENHPGEVALTSRKSDTTKDVVKSGKKSGKEEEENPISKERAKELTSEIWNLILRYPFFLITGFVGAAVFGAVFPCKLN